MGETVLKETKGSPPTETLKAVRGDTFTYFRQFRDVNGNPRDISDSDFWFEIRFSEYDNDGEALVKATAITKHQSQAAIDYDVAQSNPEETTYDQILVKVSAEDMDVVAGWWPWEIREIEPGDSRTVRSSGQIHIKESTTINVG